MYSYTNLHIGMFKYLIYIISVYRNTDKTIYDREILYLHCYDFDVIVYYECEDCCRYCLKNHCC